VGQTVCITGCSTANANLAFVQVASVPSATTFTITSTNTFNGNSSLTTAGTAFIPGTLYYNDATYDKQSVDYYPPIGRLQRLHLTLRRHQPLASIGTTAPLGAPIVFGSSQNSFTFEIEYLDNGFDDYSSMQTRVGLNDREDK
jgi:hypothetical protein